MPNIYVRDLPRDLYNRLKKKKELLDCHTWVTFFFEVDRIVTKHLEEKGIALE